MTIVAGICVGVPDLTEDPAEDCNDHYCSHLSLLTVVQLNLRRLQTIPSSRGSEAKASRSNSIRAGGNSQIACAPVEPRPIFQVWRSSG